MKINNEFLHSWDVSPKEAVHIQKDLKDRIVLHDVFTRVMTVAGVDVGFDKNRNMGKAAIAVLTLGNLKTVDTATAELPLKFPYVPGLLSFREVPVIIEALKKLKSVPDLLLCDGQGIAHPRRFGVACHLGLLTDLPAIGIAKSRLIGSHGKVPEQKGEWTELLDKDEVIGAVLRSREKVKPVFVSPGHRISLAGSVHYVMQCLTRFRLPETTRQAHSLSLLAKK